MNNKEDVRTILGRNVKSYRKQKGLSQEKLAEMIDVSVKHLSTIESGSAFLSADLLQNLADTLDVPVYLLFYEGPAIRGPSNEDHKKQMEAIVDIQLYKSAEFIKKMISELF